MIREAANACRSAMMEGGLKLDGTPESLKLLDRSMREMYRGIGGKERQKGLFLMWGSYFGEVVRDELAGGQWRIAQKNLLQSTLTWQLGEVELHLWPFKVVHEYITGQNNKSLYETWSEIEEQYIDHGLAARYAD
jgi:hypothetical protein